MKFRYVTAVTGIEIKGDLGRGDKIDESTYLTNNREFIRSLVDKRYVPIIGTLEWVGNIEF